MRRGSGCIRTDLSTDGDGAADFAFLLRRSGVLEVCASLFGSGTPSARWMAKLEQLGAKRLLNVLGIRRIELVLFR